MVGGDVVLMLMLMPMLTLMMLVKLTLTDAEADVPVVGDAQTFRQRSDAMQWTNYGDYQDYPLVEYWGTAASATANGHHRLHRIPNDVLFRAFADSAGDERIQRDLLGACVLKAQHPGRARGAQLRAFAA